jgi:hypothetical protein
MKAGPEQLFARALADFCIISATSTNARTVQANLMGEQGGSVSILRLFRGGDTFHDQGTFTHLAGLDSISIDTNFVPSELGPRTIWISTLAISASFDNRRGTIGDVEISSDLLNGLIIKRIHQSKTETWQASFDSEQGKISSIEIFGAVPNLNSDLTNEEMVTIIQEILDYALLKCQRDIVALQAGMAVAAGSSI